MTHGYMYQVIIKNLNLLICAYKKQNDTKVINKNTEKRTLILIMIYFGHEMAETSKGDKNEGNEH